MTHTFVQRVGNTPALGASFVGERVIPVQFLFPNGEAGLSTLLTRLQPLNTAPRQLRAERNDGIIVAIPAVLEISPGQSADDVNTLDVRFIATEAVWTALTDTTVSKTFSDPNDQAMSVEITGFAEIPAKVRLRPTVQRASGTADVGWTYRRRFTVTNNGDEPFVRHPVAIALGDTAAIATAGKALASGDDLRVWRDGREISRTLKAWNTASSDVWIVVPNLAAGATATYDVMYGNADAGSPPVLAYPDLPVFDLDASANGSWVYRTDDVLDSGGKGIWYIDRIAAPPRTVDFDVPGAWSWDMTLRSNQGAGDDVAQQRFTAYTATGTKYRATFDATRSRQGGTEPADNHVADGVVLHAPRDIQSITVGFSYQSELIFNGASASQTVGKLVVLERATGAERWNVNFEKSDRQDTAVDVASATYSLASGTREVACAVWPRNDIRVAKNAKGGRSIDASWNTTLTVALDTSGLAITETVTETEVYELAAAITMHEDGTERNARIVRVGGGMDRRLAVELNQSVVIDSAKRRAELWSSDLSTNLGVISPLAVVARQTVERGGGIGEKEIAGDAWLALTPYVNPLVNPTFDVDASGWSYAGTASGVTTAALTTDAERLKAEIVANTNAAGYVTTISTDAYLATNGQLAVHVAMGIEVNNADILVRPQVYWEDSDSNGLGVTSAPAMTPTVDTAYRRVFQAVAPEGAVRYTVGARVEALVDNATGVIFLDTVTVNGPEIVYDEVARGTVELAVLFRAMYP